MARVYFAAQPDPECVLARSRKRLIRKGIRHTHGAWHG